jgi:hypothetical protein
MRKAVTTAIDTVTAAVTGDDSERLGKRREVRGAIAAAKLAGHRCDILRRQIADLDRKADDAAAVHSTTCTPLQTRLSEVEQQIAAALTDRIEVDESLLSERSELMAGVATANGQLSDAVDRINRLRDPVKRELSKTLGDSQTQHLYNRLTQKGYAHPDTFRSHEAAMNVSRHVSHMVAALNQDAAKWQRHADEAKKRKEAASVRTYEERVRRIREESNLLAPTMEMLQAKQAQLWQAMIDE